MVAALGNGYRIKTSFATLFQFKYGEHTFNMFCYVFDKLKFQVTMSNRFLYERLAIVVYTELSTYLMDDEEDSVHLSNSIGELYQELQEEYLVVLAEEVTMCRLKLESSC